MPGGGEGLYEVPLVFSSPFGVEVPPARAPRDDRRRRAGALAADGRRPGSRRRFAGRGRRAAPASRSRPGRSVPAHRVEGERAAPQAHREGDGARRAGRGVAAARRERGALGGTSGSGPPRFRRRRDRGARDAAPGAGRSRGARGDGVASAHVDSARHGGCARDAPRGRAHQRREHGGQRPLRARRARGGPAGRRPCASARSSRAERSAEGGPRAALARRAEQIRAHAPFAPRLPYATNAPRAATAPALLWPRSGSRSLLASDGERERTDHGDRRGAREARGPEVAAGASSTCGAPGSRREGDPHRGRAVERA